MKMGRGKMMRSIKIFSSFIILFVLLLLAFPKPALAAKTRTRKARNTQASVSVSRGVGISVRFRPDRLGLLLNFSNFGNLESGSYELVYDSNGVTQGAGGSIMLGDTDTKELIFGTCSNTVCTYHQNITNARLSVTSRLKNGQTVLKPFRIRV